jgi:putative membrane-bound dehydrogenase-like protein
MDFDIKSISSPGFAGAVRRQTLSCQRFASGRTFRPGFALGGKSCCSLERTFLAPAWMQCHMSATIFKRLGLFSLALALLSRPAPADDLGVKVIDGFTVTEFANDDLAHDIHSMTIDSLGRIVVSGLGYVRILEDTDGDGKADVSKEFAPGPATGAQGMCFYGRDLLCIGDGGFIRYRDRDGDDKADGEPDYFVKCKTGGEHDVHAIRRGPDGSWYVISGNMAEIGESYVTSPTSPIVTPRAGTMLRFAPDLKGAEVISHGYRNAYDFDFGAMGDLFTFDSDGEPEMSLPWYEPTRVYHLTLGSDVGWHSKSWKHPQDFLDMPPVLSSFGRSSPTGVVCYRHTQFPAQFRDALFVLDWTYGRVFALPMSPSGGTWSTKPVEFMTAVGENGFAPTDAEVGPDGALYIVVGGRGTRGSVYRVAANAAPIPRPADPRTLALDAKLRECLNAPHPLSSWSRARWEPLAAELKIDAFIRSVLNPSRTPVERVRAIEILTEKFNGLDNDLLATLPGDAHWQVLARAAWSQGRTSRGRPNVPFMARCLKHPNPHVQRAALEAILSAEPEVYAALVEPISHALASTDRHVRLAGSRVLAVVPGETYGKIAQATIVRGWQATVPLALGLARRNDTFSPYAMEIGVRLLQGDYSPNLKLEGARLLQIALGDLNPDDEKLVEIFNGYTSRADLSAHERELDALRIVLANVFPTGIDRVDEEVARVIAMVGPANDELLTKVLSKITPQSSPVKDTHYLIVASRMPVDRSVAQRDAIATAVLSLEEKAEQQKLVQDSNWDTRTLDLFDALIEKDPLLGSAVADHPTFGQPGHALFVSSLPEDKLDGVVTSFVRQLDANPDYKINPDVVFVLAASPEKRVLDMLRSRFDDLSLRSSILTAFADEPEEEDRPLFIKGMDSAPTDVLAECAKALALLPAGTKESAEENVMLLRTLRRLTADEQDRPVRDQIAELLTRNTGAAFGYKNGLDGDLQSPVVEQWTAYIQQTYPDEYTRQTGAAVADLNQLQSLLASVNWESGDVHRGEKLFSTKACINCHGARKALGPDLRGAATRFSKQDLFTAIALPSRDISPRYQQTMVQTKEGKTYAGLVVYEAIDAVVLRNANNQTSRIDKKEIEVRHTLGVSLMPTGLLQGLAPGDLADLYAYLRSMSPSTQTAEALPAAKTE